MRCKKHPLDLSGNVGVCASCLRERLFVLLAAQAQAQQAQQRFAGTAVVGEDCLKSDPHPPPLIFPRSVSPYVSHRKSDNTSCHQHQPLSDKRFFYSTPQVGPTAVPGTGGRSCKKKSNKFAIISRIFWPRSEKSEYDFGVSRDPCTNSPPTSSWFPSMFSRRRKNKLRFTPGERRPRGMSPERTSCVGEDCDKSSGYSSDSSEKWRRTPASAPVTMVQRGKPSHGKNVSGLTFCLSPLVRASPNGNWNQKGLPPEMAFHGEMRVPGKPHISSAASLCANRSRKLGDFGKFSNNR